MGAFIQSGEVMGCVDRNQNWVDWQMHAIHAH